MTCVRACVCVVTGERDVLGPVKQVRISVLACKLLAAVHYSLTKLDAHVCLCVSLAARLRRVGAWFAASCALSSHVHSLCCNAVVTQSNRATVAYKARPCAHLDHSLLPRQSACACYVRAQALLVTQQVQIIDSAATALMAIMCRISTRLQSSAAPRVALCASRQVVLASWRTAQPTIARALAPRHCLGPTSSAVCCTCLAMPRPL